MASLVEGSGFLLSSGLIIRILSTSVRQTFELSALWALFFVVSIFLFLIGQVPRTSSPMHCPVFSTILIARLFPSPLCHRIFLFLRSLGRLSRRSARPRKGNASVRMPTGSFVCARDFDGPTSFDGVIVPRWACHPGVSRTTFLIKHGSGGRLWLATYDVLFWLALFVPSLRLLSDPRLDSFSRCRFPSRPWSHISLDFVTGLPASSGNTVVWNRGGPFSKAAHFIPLPKLPSAQRDSVAVIDHTFFAFMVSRQTWSLTGGLVCL